MFYPTAAASADASGSMAASLIASAAFNERIEAVIRLIETSDWEQGSFDGTTSVDGSAAFDVDGWLTSDTAADFDAAPQANWDEVQELHAAIDANGAFSAWLEGGGIETGNVVAVGETADGSLAVFTSGS
ncbi:MAG: hypothetical protein WEB63_10755 [Cucumibacter sp.]